MVPTVTREPLAVGGGKVECIFLKKNKSRDLRAGKGGEGPCGWDPAPRAQDDAKFSHRQKP